MPGALEAAARPQRRRARFHGSGCESLHKTLPRKRHERRSHRHNDLGRALHAADECTRIKVMETSFCNRDVAGNVLFPAARWRLESDASLTGTPTAAF
jgi:hypothetical protein